MKSVKRLTGACVLMAGILLAGGCGVGEINEDNEEKLSIVVTLSFFEDMVQQVGRDKVEVTPLVPVGVEPEEYDPRPADIRAIHDADIFIYNGLNMERWLPRVKPDFKEKENYFALAEQPSLETIPLPSGPFEGDPDPHLWTNVAYAREYVDFIAGILGERDEENREVYRENALEYSKELKNLEEWIEKEVEKIPREERLLVTSELCFQYFAEAYGFYHDAIWPINAPEEGSPSQIRRIIGIIEEKQPPAVFVENQVDHRPMERVSRETGVPIKGVLFSDSLSEPGEGGESYVKMMDSNTRQIVNALKEE